MTGKPIAPKVTASIITSRNQRSCAYGARPSLVGRNPVFVNAMAEV